MPKRSQPSLPFGDAATTPSPVREPARAPASDASLAGEPFAAQLVELCRRYPTRAKWLIAASHAPGLALADRLARDTGGWANLRVVTPLDLAIRMAGPSLVERGVSPSEESVGPALVMKLLRGLAPPGYFRQLADQPSLADALWRTLRELRFAGVAAPALPAGAFSSAVKHAELAALLAAFDEWLDGHHTADMARVFAHAQGDGRFCPIAERDIVVEWPYASWDPIVRRFLDSLPGERLAGERIAPAGAGASDHARTFGTPNRVAAHAATRHAARLQYVRVPSAAPSIQSTDDPSLEIFHAGGRHAEIDEVARRVLAVGRPIDEVEVVCACDDLVWLAWEKCVRLGWKVTVSSGLLGADHRARSCPGWLVRLGGGGLLRDGACDACCCPGRWHLPRGTKPDVMPRLSSSRASRLHRRGVTRRGDGTPGRVARDLCRAGGRARRRGRRGVADPAPGMPSVRGMPAGRRVGGGLLARVPDPLPGASASLAEVLAAARDLLASDAALRNPVDGLARSSLRQEIDRFEALGDEPWDVLDALRLLRGRAELLRVGVDRARPGHLHVSTLDDAGVDGRPVVFVVGLEEGRVFPAAREDPILLDAERAAIGARPRAAALLRASRPIGSGTPSKPATDPVGDARARRRTRRAVVLQPGHPRVPRHVRVVGGPERVPTDSAAIPTLSYKDLREALGDTPASRVPSSPALRHHDGRVVGGARASHRGRCARSCSTATRTSAVGSSRSPHVRATTSRLRRLRARGGGLDPARTGQLTSVSRLEMLAGVPLPLLPRAGTRHQGARRCRARPRRLARPAHARQRAARALREPAAARPGRRAARHAGGRPRVGSRTRGGRRSSD